MGSFTTFTLSIATLLFGLTTAAPTWYNSLPVSARAIVPADLGGTFTRDFAQQGQDCPNAISHTGFDEGDNGIINVPAANILQNRNQCTGNSVMAIGSNRGAVPGLNAALGANPNAERTIAALEATEATLLYGIESTPRQCGSTSLPGGTILLFFSEDQIVRLSPGVVFPANERHMLVMKPNDAVPCVYNAGARQGAATTATPESTATPAATETQGGGQPPVVVPVPAGGGGDNNGPAASAAPEPTPAETDDGTPSGGGPIVPPAGPDGEGEISESPGAGTGDGDTDAGVGGAGGVIDPDETPSESPDDGSVCFPADATVELGDGSSKTMEDLSLKDTVRVAGDAHSEVFMFTHRMKEAMYKFVKISTDAGSLTATAGHYIYVNDKLTAMRAVNIGDSLTRRDGSAAAVTKVESVMARGLFNPQTLHGDIYVNGFKASTYTTAVEPSFAHGLLAPFRALHRVGMNPLASAFSQGSDFLARFAPKGSVVY